MTNSNVVSTLDTRASTVSNSLRNIKASKTDFSFILKQHHKANLLIMYLNFCDLKTMKDIKEIIILYVKHIKSIRIIIIDL